MTKNSGMESLLHAVNAAKGGDLTVRAEETSPTLKPLAHALNEMLESLSRQASQIADSATQTLSAAEGLRRSNQAMAEGLARQQAAIAEIARKLKALEARSDEIGQIVELFDDVTSETNILALNAAIEASRAGVQGKAFGLVAEDVRKLAERSTAATKDIGAFIQTIVNSTSEANHTIEEIRSVTDTLVASAAAAGGDAAALAAAVQELAQTLAGLRFAGQEEAALARALRERRAEIADLLQPLAPLLGHATTPLGDALRRVLDALAEGAAAGER
ncbi:MAG: methyl-accepting chemotaxis protein [Polyangia bacterium]